MKARFLLKRRERLSDDEFVSIVIWEVSDAVVGSAHEYKYSPAYVKGGDCILRYDNERGKGDHWHLGTDERPYGFSNISALLKDFWNDVRVRRLHDSRF